MTKFIITMAEITGQYEAENSGAALDLFAQDAGYMHWLDAVDQGLASFEVVVVEEAYTS